MRRNKIREGWDAVPTKKKKFEKNKLSWTTQYEIKYIDEDNILSKIIKFIIGISLLFAFDRNIARKAKISSTVDYAYNILSSSKFKFIPSSVAFYLFLSIVPVTVVVISIVSFVNPDWGKVLTDEVLTRIIPGTQNMFIKIDFNSIDILFVVFFLASSIWFASKGITKLSSSFTELYGYEDRQNFIIKRIKAIFIVIIISLYFSAVATAFTPVIHLVKNLVTDPLLFDVSFYAILLVYFLIFGYIGIGFLFKYISPIRLKWSYLNLGILTSLIPSLIFLLIFSTICKLLNYEKFGAIGSIIYLLLFILYISYFLHAGIIINSSSYKANVLKNITVRRSLIPKKIVVTFKNMWYKIKYLMRKK